jgi:hypothetical protein
VSPARPTLRPGWAELADQPFAEPWEARAFALAVLTCERLDLPWDVFRDQLKAAVAAEPDRPYYESWTAALGHLVAEHAELAGLPTGTADSWGAAGTADST